MSTFAMAEGLMDTAKTEAGAAAFLLPPAAFVPFEFSLSTGKADELDKAGQEWRKAAEQIGKLCTELQQSVTAISAQDWTAEDRPAYERKIQEFCSQMAVLQDYCTAVGIALTALAYALLVYAIFAVGMGTFLAGLAAAVLAAMASVVASPSIAGMQATAATCATITHVATGILAAAGQMGALTFAGGAALSAYAEAGKGNEQALGDFMQAQRTASAAALSTLAQNGANAGLAYVNRYQDALVPQGKSVPKGLPVESVDLDADRGYDRTWNIGGGASAGSHEFGAHAKYGDRGWQGLEGEYTYTNPMGDSLGGKAGWEEDSKGNNIYSGGINGERGDTSGSLEGKYNTGDDSWSGKGEVGRSVQGVDVYNQSHEVTHSGGNTEWKHETKTAAGDSEAPPWDLI